MEEKLAALLGRAFHRAPAAEANRAIAQVREQVAPEGLSYECVLPDHSVVEYLTEKVLPRLVYFLDCRGAKLPHCQGAFVSFFAGGEIYFVHASEVVAELARWTEMTLEQLVQRYGAASA